MESSKKQGPKIQGPRSEVPSPGLQRLGGYIGPLLRTHMASCRVKQPFIRNSWASHTLCWLAMWMNCYLGVEILSEMPRKGGEAHFYTRDTILLVTGAPQSGFHILENITIFAVKRTSGVDFKTNEPRTPCLKR